ncbi:recombinase family protein [Bartonella sp. HY761]|uniref:recombinase family protein n=1 Tax=Bartonella sp. HY761 TaxID=2979330 RepID=UPI00220E78F1|nr:recombinase family protein [Bartonella sp. HY761]UXN05411.1 recombinase family protein [Bartonella sp. HY761]
MAIFAYLRVSTEEQTTDNQLKEIKDRLSVSPDYIFSEHISGSVPVNKRRMFLEMIAKMRAEDVLVVTKLDRLGRDMIDVVTTIRKLSDQGIALKCLQLGDVDPNTSIGKLTLGILSMVADFERDLIIERTKSGLARAKAQGKKLGRPKALTDKMIKKIQSDAAKKMNISQIARENGLSRRTVNRALVKNNC